MENDVCLFFLFTSVLYCLFAIRERYICVTSKFLYGRVVEFYSEHTPCGGYLYISVLH